MLASSSSSEYDSNKLLQNDSLHNNDNMIATKSFLSASDTVEACLYKPKDAGIDDMKYGLAYRNGTKLMRSIATMVNGIKENNKKTDNKISVPVINVPTSIEESSVFFVDITKLTKRNIENNTFYEIIPQNELIPLVPFHGSTKDIKLDEYADGYPARYNDELGAVYSCQAALMPVLNDYYEENEDLPEVPEDVTYFLSFKKLYERQFKPFEIVEVDEIYFLRPNEMKFEGSKIPNTPGSCFQSGKKNKANKVGFSDNKTPNVPITNVPAVTHENNTASLTESDKKNQSSDNHVVTPYNELIDSEKYIARVPGPSDITKYLKIDASRGRKASTDLEKDKVRDINRKQQDIYGLLRSPTIGWRHDVDHDIGSEDHEIFFTPLSKMSTKEGIENLSFFHTKAACYEHFLKNPCLSFETEGEMIKLLEKHGWLEEDKTDKKGKHSHTVYSYEPAKDRKQQDRLGLHLFNNYSALVRFVSRFPFPLQDDETFAQTVRDHGWINKNKKWSAEGHDGSFTLPQLRKEIWLNPALLFQKISPHVSPNDIMPFIRVPKEDAEAKESTNVPTLPKSSEQKPKKMPIEDSDTKDLVANTSAALVSLANKYCDMISIEDTVERVKVEKQMIDLMQPANGWHHVPCNWTDEWWKFEKATIAPWSIGDLKNKRSLNGMVAGIDFFWKFDDIASYINQYGHKRHNNKPMKLLLDYTSEEWTIDRRIEEIAKEKDGLSKNYNLWDLLEYTGWRKISPKGLLKKIVDFDKIMVPKWCNLSNDNFKSIGLLNSPAHYFNSDRDLLLYLNENGNNEPSILDELYESLPRSATSLTPNTPHRKIAAVTEEYGAYHQRHKEGYISNTVWVELQKLGYRMINSGPPNIESIKYITPEARVRLEEKIDKDIKDYQKVNLELLPLTHLKDYFHDRKELIAYASDRYKGFLNVPSHDQFENTNRKNMTTKAKNNVASTPSSTSNVLPDSDLIKLLSTKNCNFELLWAALETVGWVKKDDDEGMLYVSRLFAEENDKSKMGTLNRDYFYDPNELISHLRKSRKIKVEDSPHKSIQPGKSKKRSNEDEEFTSAKKSNNTNVDTVEKFSKTPEDPVQAIRYTMKEGGQWEDHHKGTHKWASVWGNLTKLNWASLNVSGPNLSSAHFTPDAIELIKERDKVDDPKKVTKATLETLIENKHYFFEIRDVLKYVDIEYCYGDGSKYQEQQRGRKRGADQIERNPNNEKMSKNAAVEKKQVNNSTCTPKNTKKSKQQLLSVDTNISSDSMTFDTAEEELQRRLEEEDLRFGPMWDKWLKPRNWVTAYPTKEILNNFWVAPWAKNKEGAVKGKGTNCRYDVSKLIMNRDYFVEHQDLRDYLIKYGLQKPDDYETIPTKTDRAFGKSYNTRTKKDDTEDSNYDAESFQIRTTKVPDDKYGHKQDNEEVDRLVSGVGSPPTGFNDSYDGIDDSPEENSKKRQLDNPVSQTAKKTKIPIEGDFKTVGEAFRLAREALSTSNVMESCVVGREKEYKKLSEMITERLRSRGGKGIYVCGAPGGGKTLLIGKLIDSLKKDLADLSESPNTPSLLKTVASYLFFGTPSKTTHVSYQISQFLGTTILSAQSFYSKLLADLEGEENTGNMNLDDLKSRVFQKFTNPSFNGKQSPKSPPPMILLVIDEIDLAPPDIVADLYTAAASSNSTLILLGIANHVNYASDRLSGLTQDAIPEILVFKPYNLNQLMEIINKRMYNLIENKVTEMLARKVEKTGDVRTLVDMASKCLNCVERQAATDKIPMDKQLNEPLYGAKLMPKVLRELSDDLDLDSLRKTSVKGLHALISLLLSGSEAKSISELVSSYNTFLAQKLLPEITGDEFRTVSEELKNNGFLVQDNACGFGGGRPLKSNQSKSLCKYNVKLHPEKLLVILKEKNINLGIAELEKMIKRTDDDNDDDSY